MIRNSKSFIFCVTAKDGTVRKINIMGGNLTLKTAKLCLWDSLLLSEKTAVKSIREYK